MIEYLSEILIGQLQVTQRDEEEIKTKERGLMKTRQFNGAVTPCIKVQRPLPLTTMPFSVEASTMSLSVFERREHCYGGQ
jgi:hypothetical protein